MWIIFVGVLFQVKRQFNCDIHSFVLMSNHYHLLISTPDLNIGEAMKYLHREVARLANKSCGRINHFFGGRYKWTVVNHEAYYWNCTKYIFRNPVRAKLCTDVQSYTYSSLNRDAEEFNWDNYDFFALKKSIIEYDLEWLNETFSNEIEEGIRKGLRRREFHIPRSERGSWIEPCDLIYRKGTVT
ncbi:MAG: transposase [Bdellovibrionales bacterium]|nr:transposase [Bdellovibrionales bacterium]